MLDQIADDTDPESALLHSQLRKHFTERWTTAENTVRGIYSCMDYIGILKEYLELIPLYSQIPTQNGTIFAKKTIFSGILGDKEYIPWCLAYEEYSEWSTPRKVYWTKKIL